MDTIIRSIQSVYGAALATLFVWFPLSIPRRTRKIAGWFIIAVSFVWLFGLWVSSGLFVFVTWGWTGLIVGFLFLGVGLIPTAITAAVFTGQFRDALSIVGWLIMAIALRFAGVFITAHGETQIAKSLPTDVKVDAETVQQFRTMFKGIKAISGEQAVRMHISSARETALLDRQLPPKEQQRLVAIYNQLEKELLPSQD